MDGVTDAAFRYVVDEIGKPSVIFTEFVPVEAIKANAQRVLDAFVTHKTNTPLVAQVYGTDLEAYYLSTLVVCELGYDGVDINMGCPAKSVQSRGAGAGLIKNPELAAKIIKTVRKATLDYMNGAYGTSYIPDQIKERVKKIKTQTKERHFPAAVSVKTRIGYEQKNVSDWISTIANENVDEIAVHGRTFFQMYRGAADWDAISEAAKVSRTISPETIFLGNGDVKNYSQISDICKNFYVDGVLVGRATLGNPWIFAGIEDKKVGEKIIFETMLLHAEKYMGFYPNGHFLSLRKHMMGYATGFDGSRKMHEELQRMNNMDDLKNAIKNLQTREE